jgi:hypothetical protein
MLLHGTIEMAVTPMDAAERFIQLAADTTKINLASNILFSCEPIRSRSRRSHAATLS